MVKGFTPLEIRINRAKRKFLMGFTIVEIFVAICITVLVIGAGLVTYIMSLTTWQEASTQIVLQRRASIAMEKMVRGINGKNGIREAHEVQLGASSESLYYTSGIDSQIRGFKKIGDELGYEDGTASKVIAENVRNLSFSLSGDKKEVTIQLGMEDRVRGKPIDVDVVTAVRIRN